MWSVRHSSILFSRSGCGKDACRFGHASQVPFMSISPNSQRNLDPETVAGFGEEWSHFDQTQLPDSERERLFNAYFSIFPWDSLGADASGFDLGCGSGRWAKLMSARVGHLHCIDASDQALEVARRNLAGVTNCSLWHASVDEIPLEDGSQDFGYSLGVLHHIPDTARAMAQCVAKLKPGAPFLVYLYYSFENRPAWFRKIWRATDRVRQVICVQPEPLKRRITDAIAVTVYWPTARLAAALENVGLDVDVMPLSQYRRSSFYTMRTDARDRFGTRLEQRFSRTEIQQMMESAGLTRITFSDESPYWCAVGYRL